MCGNTRKRRKASLLQVLGDETAKKSSSTTIAPPHTQTNMSMIDIKPPYKSNSLDTTPDLMGRTSQPANFGVPSPVYYSNQANFHHSNNLEEVGLAVAPIVSETVTVNNFFS